VVGFEVVEVAPDHDPTCSTVLNAHRAILEVLTGIAMRRKGLSGPWYLDPMTSGQVPVE
jgi:agmatinase